MLMKTLIKNLLFTVLALTPVLPATAQNPTNYKGNIALTDDPAILQANLTKGGAKYLGEQDDILFFKDRYNGLPCTLQFSKDNGGGPLILAATFQVRDNWKKLVSDYDKLQVAMIKQYGTPTSERYTFTSPENRRINEMEELLAGRVDWFSIWNFPDAVIRLELTANPTGECFVSCTWQKR